ncbi:MAG: histidine--tRNA ligase [Oligoflexia bacterium]|nr:histidine--tRNA ligase [Oligoflexia bacterium]MBF0365971.1 histidine--tRNA ligase [Oligoflexia bacterium]
MGLSKQAYKGTRDLFPVEKRVQEYMFTKMRQSAALFGYEPYDGPLLEEVELYKAKSGEELINEQIYSFTDRGGRFVAIRPEMTPTLARMVAQVYKESSRPLRWYAIPNLMRYEKPQKGRLREHWQFNCDIFGAPPMKGELEILSVAVNLMRSFGATQEHFEILINDRRVVDDLFMRVLQLNQEQAHRLYKIIDRSKKVPRSVFEQMVAELALPKKLEETFCSYVDLSSFEELFSFLEKLSLHDTKDYLQGFTQKLLEFELLDYVKYDPTIVRGLDYYTGVVFEIYDKHPENRRAICGGGAYANLLEIFNEGPLSGIGFGLGDVTLRDFLTTHQLLPDLSKADVDVYLAFQSEEGEVLSFKLASELRKRGVKVSLALSPLKMNKMIPTALRSGAKFVGILGDSEVSESAINLKNLLTTEQQRFSLKDIEEMKNTIFSSLEK